MRFKEFQKKLVEKNGRLVCKSVIKTVKKDLMITSLVITLFCVVNLKCFSKQLILPKATANSVSILNGVKVVRWPKKWAEKE